METYVSANKKLWFARVLVLLPLVLFGGLYMTLYMTGFCFEKRRYAEKSFLIEQAILYRARDIKGMPEHPSHADVVAFMQANPRCCSVEGPGFILNNSLLEKIFGLYTTWVEVIFPLTEKRASISPADGSYYRAFVAFDRCGRAIRAIGERLTESQAKSL
jgi:hypothetical protein